MPTTSLSSSSQQWSVYYLPSYFIFWNYANYLKLFSCTLHTFQWLGPDVQTICQSFGEKVILVTTVSAKSCRATILFLLCQSYISAFVSPSESERTTAKFLVSLLKLKETILLYALCSSFWLGATPPDFELYFTNSSFATLWGYFCW